MKKIKYITQEIKKIPKIIKGESYYPEKVRKSKLIRYFDNFIHILKYREANEFYNLYGMDIKNLSRQDYMDYRSFRVIRNKKNLEKNKEFNYVCLLRDKELFNMVLEKNGYETKTPTIKYKILNKKIFLGNNLILNENFIKENDKKILFIKDSKGECGEEIFQIEIKNNKVYYLDNSFTWNEFLDKLSAKEYVVQEKLIQNKKMSELYDKAVNTIRVVTIKNEITDEIEIFAKLLRIGANNNYVDNWAKGGIVVGINDNGTLKKYGFYKPGYGIKIEEHPISKIKFQGFKIPNYEIVIEEIKKIHKLFKNIHSIGWDIAITEEGFSIIEGNDNYEISLHQVVDEKTYRKVIEKKF